MAVQRNDVCIFRPSHTFCNSRSGSPWQFAQFVFAAAETRHRLTSTSRDCICHHQATANGERRSCGICCLHSVVPDFPLAGWQDSVSLPTNHAVCCTVTPSRYRSLLAISHATRARRPRSSPSISAFTAQQRQNQCSYDRVPGPGPRVRQHKVRRAAYLPRERHILSICSHATRCCTPAVSYSVSTQPAAIS